MPRLSIVVPVYNVAEYLDECLASLADQTLRDLEVVMVDDGSTDDSADLAAAWVARDERFRLVRQVNHGLGHARNTGVAAATGELLAFVDSDDVIPRAAYALMCDSLARSGSDFATGNVARFDSRGRRQSELHRGAFTRTVVGTHITRMPGLLRDRLAPNKVFTRRFWDEHGLRFPEGVLYEDIPVTIPAHYLAGSVDVIRQTVYLWREREGDALSITQDRTHLRGLEDRFAAVSSVRRFLVERGDREAVDRFDEVVLRSDLRIFMDALEDADAAFRARWLELTAGYLADVDAEVLAAIPAHVRVQYALAARGLMAELLEANRFARLEREDRGVIRVGDRYLGDYPLRGDAAVGLPDSAFDVTDELTLVTNVSDVEWVGSTLRVRGWAFVRRIDVPTVDDIRLSAWLVKGGERRPVPVRGERRPEANYRAHSQVHDYAGAGFVFDVPMRSLTRRRWTTRALIEQWWRQETWRVEIEVTAGGVTRRGRLARPLPGRPQRPVSRSVLGVRVQPRYTASRDLVVDVGRAQVVTRGLRVDDENLVLTGRWRGGVPDGAEVVVKYRQGGVALRYPIRRQGRRGFVATVPLADVVGAVAQPANRPEVESIALDDAVDWDLSLVVPCDGAKRRLLLDPRAAEATAYVGGLEVAVNRTRTGNLTIQVRGPRPIIESARWRGAVLELAGRFAAPPGARLEAVLDVQGGNADVVFPADGTGGRFTARIAPGATADGGALAPGRYDVELVAHTPDGLNRRYDARLDHAALGGLPITARIAGRTVTFGDMNFEHPVVQVGEPD